MVIIGRFADSAKKGEKMRVAVIRSDWDYFRALAAGCDIAVEKDFLFDVFACALTEKAKHALYNLDWHLAELFPETRFLFSPATEGEVLDLLKKKFPGLKITYGNGRLPFDLWD